MSVENITGVNSKQYTAINKRTAFKATTVPDYPADSVEISGKKKSGLSKETQIGIGVGVIGTIAIVAGLIARGKLSQVKQLAEHIDFTEAKTIEEAIKWGKEHLGIKYYAGFEAQDIEVINWVNKGLTNINNKMKGKWKTPTRIQYREMDDDYLACMVSKQTGKLAKYNGWFDINKKVFRDIDSRIKKRISTLEKGKTLTVKDGEFSYCPWFMEEDINLLARDIMLYNQGKLITFNDKIKLYESLRNFEKEIYSINESPFLIIKQILKYENINKIIKESGLEVDLEKIKKLPLVEQNNLMSDIMDKVNDKIRLEHTQGDLFHTIYHEIGHLLDEVARVPAKDKFKNKSEYPKELKEWLDNDENMKIASRVGEYAKSGPGEFVAEVFAEMISGTRQLSEEVKTLYKKLGGPIIP